MRFCLIDMSVLRKHEAIIRHNLDDLSSQRHEILLHVHPHWEDAVWTSDRWHFDLSRFCLNNFNSAEVMDIVKRNVDELRQHTKDGRSKIATHPCSNGRAQTPQLQPPRHQG